MRPQRGTHRLMLPALIVSNNGEPRIVSRCLKDCSLPATATSRCVKRWWHDSSNLGNDRLAFTVIFDRTSASQSLRTLD